MSFSGDVKEELKKKIPQARHCMIAELAGVISMCGKIENKNGNLRLIIQTENIIVARKCFTLIKKTYSIDNVVSVKRSKSFCIYTIIIENDKDLKKILNATKLIDKDGNLSYDLTPVSKMVVQKDCCKRAFIRGCFMVSGSISDPNKSYHFEVVCNTTDKANYLKDCMAYFQIDAKIVERKKHYVVYIKEGSEIVNILNVMEAHIALLELENVLILKGMRNTVNRKVNCETANLNKTVSAAVKQIEDIKFIDDKIGLDKLPANLEIIARLRLQNSDASLKELGEMLDPKVGKSGVNHRLRKISEIAEELQANQKWRKL